MAGAFLAESTFDASKMSAEKVLRLFDMAVNQEDLIYGRVFESGGEIVGYYCLMITDRWWSDETYAADLGFYIQPEHRGRKAGVIYRKVVTDSVMWAFLRGCEEVVLGASVGIDDERVIRWYEKIGFNGRSISVRKTKSAWTAEQFPNMAKG